MSERLATFIGAENFMPHGHCYLWLPEILWLHVISDLVIVIAYYSIPLGILYFAKKFKKVPFPQLFYLFSAFIFLCGTTHILEILVVWKPYYGLEGLVKAATAIVSAVTAYGVWKLLPLASQLKSPTELEEMNRKLRESYNSIERKIAERTQDLSALVTKYEVTVNTVVDGLITIDSEGNIQTFNRAAEKIFGYQLDEVLGKDIRILMPEPYSSNYDSYIHNFLRTGDKEIFATGREVIAKRKDGSLFPMELGVNDMRLGETRMLVGTVRDITERKETEAAIQSYLEKLKRSNQELDDFAYIASHDLKEPIRGLLNNAIFLMDDYGEKIDDAGKKRLNRMVYLCKRMERLVDDLLYFSRLGRQELAVQLTDLNQIIRDIELMLETTLHDANATIKIPRPLPSITCDVPRVTEVFRNLISNAIKYNKQEKKSIEIGVVENERPTTFYVKDNGIGIEERFFSDIFRIFKRLNEEDDTVKGTGVGLTFVKKIIERHGGKIWLNSAPNKGTTFYFTLYS